MTDKEFYERERANDILNFIISLQAKAIRAEKASAVPDASKIAQLRDAAEFYTQEQDLVLRGDKAAIERTTTAHYPKFQAAYDEYSTAPITPEERQRRQAAVDYARASVGLEGIQLSSMFEERARRFVNGEIDMIEFKTGFRYAPA